MLQTDGFHIFSNRLRFHIRELRKAQGLSQEALGEQIGLDRVSIGYIEQGRRTPSLRTLYNLAQAFNMEVSDLLRF
jgi:transcriptional regulator with XRE-family HTH domain